MDTRGSTSPPSSTSSLLTVELDLLERGRQAGGRRTDRRRQVRPEGLRRAGAAGDRREDPAECLGDQIVGVAAGCPAGDPVGETVIPHVELAVRLVVAGADQFEQGDGVEVAEARRTGRPLARRKG